MHSEPNPLEIWDVPKLAGYLGVTAKTISRMHKSGIGPRRLQLSPKRVGYRWGDIQEWLDSRASLANA